MRNMTRWVFLVVLILWTTAQAQDREQVGDVDRVQQSASATFDGATRSLSSAAPVWFEDLLQTGPDSRLAVTLADGTNLTLGENAGLLVDAFVYAPDSGKLGLEVVQGAFLFIGGQLEDKPEAEVTIKTPVAALTIRGTTVWGGPIDGAFGVLTVNGRVTVSNAAGRVELKAGQGTMIHGPGQAPGKPVPWSEEKINRAVTTITFSDF